MWMRLVALLVVAAAPLGAQSACPLPAGESTVHLQVGKAPSALPAGALRLQLADARGTPLTHGREWARDLGGAPAWTPAKVDIDALAAAQKQPEGARLLITVDGAGATCVAPYDFFVPTSGGQSAGTGPGVAGASLRMPDTNSDGLPVDDACQRDGRLADDSLRGEAIRRRTAPPFVVLFRDRGALQSTVHQPCYTSPRNATFGDAIHVGVYTIPEHDAAVRWSRVTFNGCEPLDPKPAVLDGSVTTKRQAATPGTYEPVWFARRHCSGRVVDIAATGQGEVIRPSAANGDDSKSGEGGGDDGETTQTVTHSYVLEQAERFRATVQTGALFNGLQNQGYALRTLGTDTSRIYNAGPVRSGPVYVATVVLYGFLKYLPSLTGGMPYRGRDVLHESGLLDRIGLVAGAGLPKPGDNFVGGVTLELLPGVDLMGVWHVARLTEIADGLREGDIVPKGVTEVPTRSTWGRRFVTGVSLDLRYVTRLAPP